MELPLGIGEILRKGRMAIEVEIDKAAGIAVFKLSGPLSAQVICSALDELVGHPDFMPGTNILAVFNPGSFARLKLGDICSIAEYETSRVKPLGWDYRLALVVSSTVDFGMSRMYQTWSEHYPRECRVFHSLTEARAWVSADMPVSGVRTRRPLPSRPTGTRGR